MPAPPLESEPAIVMAIGVEWVDALRFRSGAGTLPRATFLDFFRFATIAEF